ncbi:MAG: hypothetical protein WAM79_07555 [Candidatus Sulfotelmatobacter sp.]
MMRRILPLSILILALGILSACGNGIDKLPGASSGAVTVQIAQGPPTPTVGGQPVGLVANALNDTSNKGVTWACTPVGACGTFNPTTTPYSVGTLYTPPVAPANGPITPNLSYSVTITATSVADSTKSVSTTFNVAQQYAFVLAGNGSFGMVGSVTLDGSGNIVAGEADASANGFYSTVPSITGTYALDSTGHGFLSMSLNNTSCCGTFQQTQGITATSNSHLVIAEEDQFNGLTIGGVGSMDLQTAPFAASQVSSGYSFTLAGYSGANSSNASWGGIFSADGMGALSGGIFDENIGGGTGYSSVPFTGTFTAPDANGRGTLTLSATTDTPTQSTQYAYYIVTPGVLRLTSITNTSNAGNTGSAYGQGSVGTTDSALSGSFIFSGFGFTSDTNGGESGAAAGQLTTDGGGNITAGVMDVNAFGTVTTSSLAGSTYSIAGSPRGTLTASSGQTYNVYLTDPSLNLLDPNNPAGGGGALLLETDVADMTGLAIPQTDTSASLTAAYGILLSDQNNLGGCCNYDGGFTGQFTVSTSSAGTYSGEGDFQGQGTSNATPIVGPLTGTFSADGANPGRFTGSITTAPAFPLAPLGSATPGTENVSYYLANSSTGFIVETDSTAPVFGFVEAQGTIQSAQKRISFLHQRPVNTSARPTNSGMKQIENSRRSR